MNLKFMTAEEAVNQVIEIYIESMEKSSGDMVTEAFHENAKVVGYLNGDFLQLSTSDFAGFVSAQEPGAVEFEILSCEVYGNSEGQRQLSRDIFLGLFVPSQRRRQMVNLQQALPRRGLIKEWKTQGYSSGIISPREYDASECNGYIVTYPSIWVATLDRLWYDLSTTVCIYAPRLRMNIVGVGRWQMRNRKNLPKVVEYS